MRTILLFSVLALCVIACQKEVSTELNNNEAPADSTGVDAFYIKIEDSADIYQEDSVVLRYGANRIDEVHYNEWYDSAVKTYLYDGSGKLIEINSKDGIYDLSGSNGTSFNATRMQFIYGAAGELSQINTEYPNHAATTTWFNFSQQGGKYNVVMYDTGYADLDKRIVYYTLNSERYLEQDSTVFLNFGADTGYKLCFNYELDAGFNVSRSVSRLHKNSVLQSLDITAMTRHNVVNPYETARRKLFANLANWLPFTHYFSWKAYSFIYLEQPRSLINTSTTDQYIFIFATPDHYQNEWKSTIELKDNKVIKRVSTLTTTGLEQYTINERFYYQ